MDQKIEFPNEIYGVISSTDDYARLRLFGQTSSYLWSLSWQIKFLSHQKANDHKGISYILIELLINHPLLLKMDAQSLLRSWCIHLREFRKKNTNSVINSLLATALLLCMDKDNKSILQTELLTLIELESRVRPQIANSILALVSQTERQTFNDHSLRIVLEDKAPCISLIEAKLLIAPFIEDYARNKYFSAIFKERTTILHPQMHNFFNIIIALLKMLPMDSVFWKTPFETVPNLLIFLREQNHHCHVIQLAEILDTIQQRLEDKQFLTKYHSRLTTFIDDKEPLSRAIQMASKNAEIALQSVAWIVENKDIFLQGDTDSITYLSHHLTRLNDSAHIKLFIDKGLETEPTQGGMHPAFQNVFTLSSKITSPDFLMETIKKLYIKFRESHNYHKQLADVCKHPLLDEPRISQLFKEIYEYYVANNTNQNGPRKMLTVLCSRIQSQPAIQDIFELITCNRDINNLPEWLNEEREFVYLECLFILLSNNQDEETLVHHTRQLLNLVSLQAYRYKAHGMLTIITGCLFKISTTEHIEALIQLFIQLNVSALITHLSAVTLQLTDSDLIQKCIDKFKDSRDLMLNKQEYSQWCLDALPLLFNLPSEVSMRLASFIQDKNTMASHYDPLEDNLTSDEENSADMVPGFF